LNAGLSDAMYVVRHSEHQGRYLEAAQSLKAGDVVLDEPAILMLVAHEVLLEFCAQCLRQLPAKGVNGYRGPVLLTEFQMDTNLHMPHTALCITRIVT
jgi:hypothetical protein